MKLPEHNQQLHALQQQLLRRPVMKRRIVKVVLMLSCLLFLPAATVFAVPITQEAPFSDVGYKTFTFDQFDTTLGTLDSISVEFELISDGGYIVFDNDTGSQATGDAEFGATGSVVNSSVSLLNSSGTAIFSTLSSIASATGFTMEPDQGDGSGTIATSGIDTYQLLGGTPSTDSENGLIGESYFSQYIGTGTFTVNPLIETRMWTDVSPAPQQSSDPAAISGAFTVVYNYTASTPVPEPATMLLFGGGLIGAAAFGRKRLITK